MDATLSRILIWSVNGTVYVETLVPEGGPDDGERPLLVSRIRIYEL